MGEPDAKVPDRWPEELNTKINLEHPINMSDSFHHYGAYITVSAIIFTYPTPAHQ